MVPTDKETRSAHDWRETAGGFECSRCHLEGIGRNGVVTDVKMPDLASLNGLNAVCRVMHG